MRRQHGKETRKYIKYDDDDYSIFLELRLPGNPVWLRISPFLARELKEQADREDLMNARNLLTRPHKRSNPELDFSANFSPIMPREENRPPHQTAQGQEREHSRIITGLRAESMRNSAAPGPSVETGQPPSSSTAFKPSTNEDQTGIGIPPRTSATQDGRQFWNCLLYTSPSPRDRQKSRMPSSA